MPPRHTPSGPVDDRTYCPIIPIRATEDQSSSQLLPAGPQAETMQQSTMSTDLGASAFVQSEARPNASAVPSRRVCRRP